jgi:hypothetical protein
VSHLFLSRNSEDGNAWTGDGGAPSEVEGGACKAEPEPVTPVESSPLPLQQAPRPNPASSGSDTGAEPHLTGLMMGLIPAGQQQQQQRQRQQSAPQPHHGWLPSASSAFSPPFTAPRHPAPPHHHHHGHTSDADSNVAAASFMM